MFTYIPAEYENDPELWQAMQASMADVERQSQNQDNFINDDLKLVDYGDDVGDFLGQGYQDTLGSPNLARTQSQGKSYERFLEIC